MDLDVYLQARVAHSIGEADKAVRSYQTALELAPGNGIIAEGAFAQAIAAGDQRLAIASARILEQGGSPSAEVRLMLLVDAVQSRDWAGAEKQIALLRRDNAFTFITPILAAWVAVGTGRDDPIELIGKLAPGSIGGIYAQDHKPLLLLAKGQEKEGFEALRARLGERESRADRLKVAGAARLARKGKRREALELLQGESGIIVDARARIERRERIAGEIATPADGIAELFLRLALDLERQNESNMALSLARLASFAAPHQSETWIVTTGLLIRMDREKDALATLRNIGSDDPARPLADDLRIRLLAETGEQTAALAQAYQATTGRGVKANDWERLGDLYTRLGRNHDAADAYGKAIQASGADSSARSEWTLWLAKGGAHDQAGQWPEAKAALETAYKLAPDEPLVLNYLGYAQLVRRENLKAAEDLIRQARKLNPESAQITDSLGWARFLLGDSGEAISLLERAVRSEPHDSTINEHLGDAYFSVGRRYEARYAWQQALVRAEGKDATRLKAKIDKGYSADLASP